MNTEMYDFPNLTLNEFDMPIEISYELSELFELRRNLILNDDTRQELISRVRNIQFHLRNILNEFYNETI